jgi:cytochrome P450
LPETSKFDPLAPEVLANPFPAYKALRDTQPVQHYDGLAVPYYILLKHRDVYDACVDTDRYTAKFGPSPAFMDPATLREDGAAHLAFRMLLQGRFTPRSLNEFRARMTGTINELIDNMMAAGAPAEIYSSYAWPLPTRMTAVLLGIQEEDRQELAHLADRIMLFSWTMAEPEEQERLRDRVWGFFDRQIDDRFAALKAAGVEEPGREHVGVVIPDDAISDLVCGKALGRRLTRKEMQELCQVLLVGGIETTAHLITNCIWRLLEDRSRWEAVRADPDRLIPVAIEESLRFDPPGLGLWRTTAREFELHGQIVPAHAKVQMSYGSANRDPEVFSDPDTFRLDRPMSEMRQHTTFGAGPHICVGQHLARLEMTMTLQAFFERMPDLHLAGPTERIENFGFWGRGKLPVAW